MEQIWLMRWEEGLAKMHNSFAFHKARLRSCLAFQKRSPSINRKLGIIRSQDTFKVIGRVSSSLITLRLSYLSGN